MKLKTAFAATAAFCLGVSGVVSANEVVATADGRKIALDFVNSGGATAFQFELAVPAGARVDTSRCASELPASHSGACKYNEESGSVVMIVYSNENAILPNGVVPLGSISVSGANINKPAIGKLLVSDVAGKSMAVTNSRQTQEPVAGARGQKK